MNIGIVTFYDLANYGAVLQAYALQSVLTEMGHVAYHVDFEEHKTPEDTPNNPLLKKIIQNKLRRDEHFGAFRKAHIITKTLTDSMQDESAHYLVGSDQVWNPDITLADERYFLSFAAKERRHSFACSLGAIVGSSWERTYAAAFKEFANLSVREASGATQVYQMTGIKPKLVLDPSLLLEQKKWEAFINKDNHVSRPYILLITVQNDKKLLDDWTVYAEQCGCDLKLICASYFPPVGFEPWSGVSVTDWLNAVYHAEEVVTSSFHGLAFSLLFGKRFHVIGLDSTLKGRNNRLFELLSQFGLDTDDNAKKVCNLLQEKREESRCILREMFSHAC